MWIRFTSLLKMGLALVFVAVLFYLCFLIWIFSVQWIAEQSELSWLLMCYTLNLEVVFFLGPDFICLFDSGPVFFPQQSIKSTNKLTLAESPERNAFPDKTGISHRCLTSVVQLTEGHSESCIPSTLVSREFGLQGYPFRGLFGCLFNTFALTRTMCLFHE